ncbi:MAG: Hsp20/alpha crystallin family protein [Clostridia bacterium]|nr:Hsp20/alpha crystallin family protein [Clostridia bacterium]
MKNYLSRRNDENRWLNFWSDPFEDFFKPMIYGERQKAMSTDINETEKEYELAVDLPGFDKSEINVSLRDGYLTIEANKSEKQENKNYLRRERSYSCSRSFYVGEDIEKSDIKAKYDKGILSLTIPKKEQKKIQSGNIEIE